MAFILSLSFSQAAAREARDAMNSLLAVLGQPHIDARRVVMEIPLAERPGIR